jgi:hypothetical protein
MKENDLVTIGCDKYSVDGVMQRRNKLKGIAQQKLLLGTMDSKDDLSIETLRKIFQDNISKLYIVEASLIINNHIYERKSDYIIYDRLQNIIEAKTRTKIKDKTIKICSNCGQTISAFNQWSRRCYKCMNGNFRFPTEKITYDRVIHPFAEKDKVLDVLIKKGYIKQCSFLNKRLDFFRFHDGVFDIFESKNKEKTSLTYSDYFRSLRYPIMVEQCGYDVKQLTIIYNGSLSPKIIKRFEQEINAQQGLWIEGKPTKSEVLETPIDIFNFKIVFMPIGKYLNQNNIYVEKIIVSKDNGCYKYQIIDGESEYVTIDLSRINEEWNAK